MDLNKQVDKLAGDALDTARGLHEAISARETALARAEAVSAEISTAVARRLLKARLPHANPDARARTLTDVWTPRAAPPGGAGSQ